MSQVLLTEIPGMYLWILTAPEFSSTMKHSTMSTPETLCKKMDILSFLHLYTLKKRITTKYLIIIKDNTVSIIYIQTAYSL